ncbi:hypothetical protein [Rhizobium sp. FKL33]|uniref:hypothetical protein n=1 Tax=Rhizobium sp. FKL33 TaxID=2562307 RepID=UPI0010C12A73|nr:hypothetical protein [Rhizobium sp. FKL33]
MKKGPRRLRNEPFASSGVDAERKQLAKRMAYFGDAHNAAGSSSGLDQARALVIRFLADLRDQPIGHDVLDAAELPATRPAMIEAFRLLIANEPRFRIRDQLKLVGLLLAQYQDGVGARLQVKAAPCPTEPPGSDPPDNPTIRLIERTLSAVEPDRLALARLFDRAAIQARSGPVGAGTAQPWRHREHVSEKSEWMAR